MKLVLGLDTSCYTTSLALLDETGELVAEARELLPVAQGQRGLRQSEAFFQHFRKLPLLLEELFTGKEGLTARREAGAPGAAGVELGCVVASTRPRPVAGAYLPVFLAGASLGRSLAALAGCPFVETTHQEGHLRAGLWAGGAALAARLVAGATRGFLAVHLSGGTTEILRVEGGPRLFVRLEVLGGSTDLHAGQFIDRLGVALGLPFPAGPALEALGREGREGAVVIPSAVQGYNLSFSGPLAQAERFLAAGARPADLALAAELCVARSLVKVLDRARRETGLVDILLAGGVAANREIQAQLQQALAGGEGRCRLYFAGNRYSGDNAVGVALAGTRWGEGESPQSKLGPGMTNRAEV